MVIRKATQLYPGITLRPVEVRPLFHPVVPPLSDPGSASLLIIVPSPPPPSCWGCVVANSHRSCVSCELQRPSESGQPRPRFAIHPSLACAGSFATIVPAPAHWPLRYTGRATAASNSAAVCTVNRSIERSLHHCRG